VIAPARRAAFDVVRRVFEEEAYTDRAFGAAAAGLEPRDRALAQRIAYGTVQRVRTIDHGIDALGRRPVRKLDPPVVAALRTAAYELAWSEAPAHAVADDAVELVREARLERATAFTNAVVRRLAEGFRGLVASLPEGPLKYSYPDWIHELWVRDWGEAEAFALERAQNEPPPLEDYRGMSRASRLAAEAVGSQPGERVLDACAAPGGKATAIAERVGPAGAVLALDRHGRRLDLVRRHARRLGLASLRCAVRDASRPLGDLASEGPFDRVLVDAPCSGLGTLRRNPDARWRIGPGDPARLAEAQRAILRQAATLLRPGGVLVYSTCTLLPEENEAIVSGFLDETPYFAWAGAEGAPAEARPLVGPDGAFRSFPHRHDADGFFAARLERRP